MNKLDLTEAVDHDGRGGSNDAEFLGPAVAYRDAQRLEVVGREKRHRLFGFPCNVHRKKIRARMQFLEFLERGQLRAARQSTRRPEGE